MAEAKYKQKLREIFEKLSVDPKALGIKLESVVKLEAEAKLADGSSIYSSAAEWAIGVDCYTKDADGNPVPAPAGEYMLEDGSMIIIDDKGMVSEIKTPNMEEEMSKEDIFAIVTSLAERISSLEKERGSLIAELASEKKKSAKVENDLSSIRTELSSIKSAPAAASIKDRNNVKLSSAPSKSFDQMSLRERIEFNLSK